MKNLFIALCLAVTLPVLAGQNDTGTIATGVPYVAAGGTSNALSTAYIETKNHQEVAVQYRQISSGTNIDAAAKVLTFTFGGSAFPSNFVTIGTVSGLVGNSAGTAASFGTNLYIGSYRYFAVISVASTATNGVFTTNTSSTGTAGSINYIFKDKRNGVQ